MSVWKGKVGEIWGEGKGKGEGSMGKGEIWEIWERGNMGNKGERGKGCGNLGCGRDTGDRRLEYPGRVRIHTLQ